MDIVIIVLCNLMVGMAGYLLGFEVGKNHVIKTLSKGFAHILCGTTKPVVKVKTTKKTTKVKGLKKK